MIVWKWVGLVSALGYAGYRGLAHLLHTESPSLKYRFPVWLAVVQVAYWLATWLGSLGLFGGTTAAVAFGWRLSWVAGVMVVVALVTLALEALARFRAIWSMPAEEPVATGQPHGAQEIAAANRPAAMTPGAGEPRIGMGLGVLLLTGLTLTRHAPIDSAFPVSSVLFAWIHLAGAAVWVGAVLLALDGVPARSLVRWVAAALAVVTFTGIFSAEGRGISWAALAQTAYGRLLLIKLLLVAVLALLGGMHVRVSRRAPSPRAWWTVVGLEGLTAVAVVAVAALLTWVPSPPRGQIQATPGPSTEAGESLVESTNIGQTLVRLQVTPNLPGVNRVHLLLAPGHDQPAPTRARIRLLPEGDWITLSPTHSEQGATFTGTVSIPKSDQVGFAVAYQHEGAEQRTEFRNWPVPVPGALALLQAADEAMMSLSSYRVHETLSDGRYTSAKWFTYVAPDRARIQGIDTPGELRIIGQDRWFSEDGKAWEHDRLARPIKVPDVDYAEHATEVRLLGRDEIDGRSTWVISFRYGQTSTRFKAWVESDTYRMLRLEMTYPQHYMVWLFDQFDAGLTVTPP